MKREKLVLLTILAALTAGSPVAATTPPAAAPAPPAPSAAALKQGTATPVTHSGSAAQSEVKTPEAKPDKVIIRLNAPLLSPRFSSTPLAVVNDEAITFEDLKKAIGMIHAGMSEDKSAPKKNFADVLKRLINSTLMIQEARNIQLDKTDEIKQPMDEFKKAQLRETILSEHVKDIVADEKEVDKVYRQRTREWRIKSIIMLKLSDTKAMEAALKEGKPFDELYNAAIGDGRGRVGGKVEDFISRDAINPTMLEALEKLKVGEVGKPIPIEKGYVVYRVEEIRNKEDSAVRDQVRAELVSQLKVASLKKYQEALTKKYFKVNQKVFDKLNYDNKKVKFDSFLKDKRVVVEAKGGGKPITVAELSEAVAEHFYHGVKRAVDSGKVNKEKRAILDQMLGTLAFDKEARTLKLDVSEEYLNKVKSEENKMLFGTFIAKIVAPDITISRDEAKAYYSEHVKEYVSPESYALAAIAFDSPEKAEGAVKKLKEGTDFKWYADNAEGLETVSLKFQPFFDGSMISKDELPQKMQQALFGAVKGDYRVFVDGITGYVLSVQEYKPSETKPYEAVEGLIREKVSYDKLNKAAETWATKLRESSEVIIYADFDKQEKP